MNNLTNVTFPMMKSSSPTVATGRIYSGDYNESYINDGDIPRSPRRGNTPSLINSVSVPYSALSSDSFAHVNVNDGVNNYASKLSVNNSNDYFMRGHADYGRTLQSSTQSPDYYSYDRNERERNATTPLYPENRFIQSQSIDPSPGVRAAANLLNKD
jgi:hypothetical protein